MEKEEPESEDRMLRWIASSMGFELHHEAEYVRNGTYEPDRWWFMSRPFPYGYTSERRPGWRMTTSFYTQRNLLNNILGSRTAFLDGGKVLRNPFYDMSRDEIALRMAAAGA
jgi:hypothetical protein